MDAYLWMSRLTFRERMRQRLTWHYWRQVGPMYRLTLWWLNR